MEILQNFVAFSEYMNFTTTWNKNTFYKKYLLEDCNLEPLCFLIKGVLLKKKDQM